MRKNDLFIQFYFIVSCLGIIALGTGEAHFAFAQNLASVSQTGPFKYNPVLDAPPIIPKKERSVEWTKAASGFRVGSFAGVSFGSAASYLSPRISSLDVGTFPLFGLSLSLRFGANSKSSIAKMFELSFNTALGFGRTYEKGDYDNALDVHIRPMLTAHLLEGQRWGLASSLGLNAIIFDTENGEVSQFATGLYLAPRITWKLSDLAQLYLEFAWSPIYDHLAYEFREPTEEELEENPQIIEIKEKGAWFNQYQVLGGLRLLGF